MPTTSLLMLARCHETSWDGILT